MVWAGDFVAGLGVVTRFTVVSDRNWAGNLTYAAQRVVRPRTIDEVQQAVAGNPVVKALGTRHCFSDIADTTGVHLDLAGLDVPTEITPDGVTVSAAKRYGDLAPELHEAGLALATLASLPHCSVAGSIATATHGSGLGIQNLSAAVSAVELVTADGEVRRFSRGDDVFPGVAVHLGALGVLTRVTLDVLPAFELRQDGYVGLTWDAVLDSWEDIQAAGYSVSLFTRWAGEQAGLILVKSLAGSEFFQGSPTLPEPPGPHFTDFGVAGPWHLRLPHFRLDATPSVGDELQSEYYVPYTHAAQALNALREIGDQLADALHTSEVRTLAADDLWLSPAYGTDQVCLAFTWQPKPDHVRAVLPVIEERLVPFGARSHWGKLATPDMPLPYPRLPRFRELAATLDPNGKFRNAYLDPILRV